MDKKSIIGFVLIFLIMMGFFGYQSRQVKKQMAYQAQLDSIAAAEAYAQWQQDSIWRAEHPRRPLPLQSLARPFGHRGPGLFGFPPECRRPAEASLITLETTNWKWCSQRAAPSRTPCW